MLLTPLVSVSADAVSDLKAEMQRLLERVSTIQHELIRIQGAPDQSAAVILAQTTSTQTTTTTSSFQFTNCPSLSYYLKYGSVDLWTKGEVTKLQTFLSQDPTLLAAGNITGFFGLRTQTAVNAFQTRYGIEVTSTVGPITRAKIASLCGDKYDTTAPKILYFSPAGGATVTGLIEMNALASDNIGVKNVAFVVDNRLLGVDESYPYAWKFDTRTLSNGTHTFTVFAEDFAGNKSASVSSVVTSSNATVTGSGALKISVSPTPAAQTIIGGSTGVVFTNYQLDASLSAEDIRLSSLPLILNGGLLAKAGGPAYLSNCQLFEKSSAITTGLNAVNPEGLSGSFQSIFYFDNPLIVPKGVVATLTLKCTVAGSAAGGSQYQWGILSGQPISVTGVLSGADVAETVTQAYGSIMTVASQGSFSVFKDASSPAYQIQAGGTSGVTLGVLRIRAINEAVNLQKIALQLSGTPVESQSDDLTQVTIWDGATQVGSAVFTGSSRNATSTFLSPVTLNRDVDRLLTIKGDLSLIGSFQAGTQGGLIKVDYDADDVAGTSGTGVSSGSTIYAFSPGDTAMDGVRVFRSYPAIAVVGLPTTGVADGRLMRFRVSASQGGDIGISKITFSVVPTGTSVSNVNLYGYTDSSFSIPVSGVSAGGQLMTTNQTPSGAGGEIGIVPQTTSGVFTSLQIPAGEVRYFELRGVLSGSSATYSVMTTMHGDAAYPQLSTPMGTRDMVEADINDDFIWSPNATTFSSYSSVDWTNGYGVIGLPTNSSGVSVFRTQ